MYAMALDVGRSLYAQAQNYIKECGVHEEALDRKIEEADALCKEGKLVEAKKILEDVKKEAKPQPLEFEF